MSEVMVSIVCTAYNHEAYIADALESFLMQKTDFPFEIVINDDASTDKTADIIREYEKKYPDRIRPIYQKENQYSKKVPIVNDILVPFSKGKYIALCEGDDYWTDPCKLQKQFDLMEAHPEVDMCAHRASRVDAVSKSVLKEIAPMDHDGLLTIEEVIKGGGGYLATNALFYRREIDFSEYAFRNVYRIDYTRQILGALRGGILYLNDNMSAYRWMASNSWTKRVELNPSLRIPSLEKTIAMLEKLNEETDHKYDAVVSRAIANRRYVIFEFRQDIRSIMQEPYRTIYKEEPLKSRLMTQLRCRVPGFYTIRRILKQAKAK